MKVRLLALALDIVIIEGGPLSELADLLYGFHSIPKLHIKIITAISSIHPYILLECDHETIVKRRKHKAEAEEFIRIQRQVLQWYAKRYKCLLLNTSALSVEKTQTLIRGYIIKTFRK